MSRYRRTDPAGRRAGTRDYDVLAGNGVKLPKAVVDTRAALDTLRSRMRDLPAEDAHRAAAVAALHADPSADVDAYGMAEAAGTVVADALRQTLDETDHRLKVVIEQHADTITATIRSTIFEPALATLTTCAPLYRTASLADLVTAGRTEEAEALASLPVALERIGTAYELRNRLYRRPATDMRKAWTWENPDDLVHIHLDADEPLLAGIRQGGRPWLPTHTEMDELDQRLRRDAKAERDLHTDAAAGNTVARRQLAGA